MFFKRNTKKRILILWYTCDNNLGDYFLFNTVRNYAIKWGFDVQDMDIGLSYKLIAKKARKFDLIWFAGGGIIERYIPNILEHFPEFYEMSKHIPYGITGVSIGDFDYSSKIESLKAWVKNATFFYARDVFSTKFLNGLVDADHVKPSVDVVFAYDKFDVVNNQDEKSVGINFREMPYPDLTGNIDWSAWNRIILDSFNQKIIGIPDQHDMSIHFSFSFEREYTPQNAVKIISKIDFGIAMRYHVILIAALYGKICIPIDYCPKVSRLAEQLGVEDLIIHYNEFGKLPFVIRKYRDNEDFYKKKIRENVIIMKKQANKMFGDIKSILKEM